MQKNFGIIFGGIVAYILLGLYAGIVIHFILGVLRCADNAKSCKEVTGGMIYVVTTIGGLVSALVVSKLTLTQPGENPGTVLEAGGQKEIQWATNLALAYLAVWLITGLSALIVGVMIHPNINSTLSDIGTTWLGLAVASGYAYFGLNPPASSSQQNSPE